MSFRVALYFLVSLVPLGAHAQDFPPVIDVHQHAVPASFWNWASTDGSSDPGWFQDLPPRASTNEALIDETLTAMDRNNIVTAIFSGSPQWIERWMEAAPGRVVRGSNFAGPCDDSRLSTLRELHENQGYEVMGEISWPFAGIPINDSQVEACYSLAEELDIPMGIHMGPGFPGAHQVGYRASASHPLLLEGPLARHPDVRLYIMHAGWPFIDETIAVMHVHPQVYADLSLINWFIPKESFYRALRRLMDAGLGDRLMYGSDAGVWPAAIDMSLDRIRQADFLTEEEKRAILYNNAAKFFRFYENR